MDTTSTKLDHRTKDAQKPRSKVRIRLIVEKVAVVRGVECTALFQPLRGSEKIASARSVAMAACCAVGVPMCHVARAFGRDWPTVHSAELMASRRYQSSATFRKEWDIITAKSDEQ